MDALALTIDIDWASDWMVRPLIDACRDLGVPATVFATHDSPLTKELADDPLFELGIHPNFMTGSSHGDTPEAVLDHCFGFAPKASSVRSHGLVCSSNLLATMARRHPSISVDSSLFLPWQPAITPVLQYFRGSSRPLVRAPLFWSDYYACLVPGWDWRGELPPSTGLKVLLVHPIHMALNTESLDRYDRLKSALRDTTKPSEDEIAAHRHHGDGAATFLLRLLESRRQDRWLRLDQLPGLMGIDGKGEEP